MTTGAALSALAGLLVAVGPVIALAAHRERSHANRAGALPEARWARRLRSLRQTARIPGASAANHRRRVACWVATGLSAWVVTGWPVAGAAIAAVGVWLPWLLGSGRVAQERIDRLEAIETWCRRMADTLRGGGAVGLAQAITVSAQHVDEQIAEPVGVLARRLRDGGDVHAAAREFADTVDDRVGDIVAAALLLALHQQSAGVSHVLRQLADGVARDVRARRSIEAERAESRQSIRMLLLIQGGILVLLALVPQFAAPYSSSSGQLVMAMLLAGTVVLLVWMRRLALGRRAPRFLGKAGLGAS